MSCKLPEKYFPAIKTPMLPAGTLKNKIAFITGGGTGLGKTMALAFASLGAQVAIASRRMEVLQSTADEITQKTGQKVVPIQMDVRNAGDVTKAADQCVEKLGLPNVVVNNAAGNFIQATERLSPNAFKTVIEIVMVGTVNVTLEFGKRLIKANQGATFLAITTPYAHTGSPFVTPSAASKAGVENLTKSLAAEWGKYGMRFNCIAPGGIYTEGAFSRLDPTGEGEKMLSQQVPVGRNGEPEELANLASYLVSDYSSWMSGSIIELDGGDQRMRSGLFSGLHQVTSEQWEMLEAMIRGSSEKSKL